MRESILNFAKQFAYEPVIENEERLGAYKKFIVLGMGGSHLAADLLKVLNPALDIIVRSDYGLPKLDEAVFMDSLIILSSYSGNTEEPLDAFREAEKHHYPKAALFAGGALADYAKKLGVPYIQMPDTGIQPRMALGFSLKALLKIMGEEAACADLKNLSETLYPEAFEKEGRALALRLQGKVPVIYSSADNGPIASIWKIKFNETGKIPAFYNVFPELNHNEMTGFDVKESSHSLSEKFLFIILKDPADHPRVLKRMDILAKLYQDRGLPVEIIELAGRTPFEKIFSSLLLADWTALFTAEYYGLEAEQVPMVEEFKKHIIQ